MATLQECKGSYRKHPISKKWEVRIPLGWNDNQKKYTYYTEYTNSEPDAILAIKQINEYLYFGGDEDVYKISYFRNKKIEEQKKQHQSNIKTFSEFAKEIIENRTKSQKVSKGTLKQNNYTLNRLIPYIGHRPIDDIKTEDIEKMFAEMKVGNEKNLNKQPYANSSILKCYDFLSLIFNKALDYELIRKNPMLKVDKPKVKKNERQPLTKQEAQELYLYIEDNINRFTIGLAIGLLCGARLSEMLALKWSDYDGVTILISKSLEKDSFSFKETKNGEQRYVTCPKPLTIILDKWLNIQKEQYKKLNLKWSREVPIVHSKTGTNMNQSNYRRWILENKSNLPLPSTFTFHILRHTYTTLIFRDCGVDEKTVRSLTGHKSANAFDIYTHTNNEWKQIATDRLSEIIAPSDDTKICENCKLWSKSPLNNSLGVCFFNNEITKTSNNFSCDNFQNS